ncbi:MAG: radical SAM protein [Candidatus Aminicenantes bacterium]|nr:radical SAM protein [Candidatus Aminicenantes bacterium]
MECSRESQLTDSKAYLLEFNKKVARQRVPVAGNIELTKHCNLNCTHCYLGDKPAAPGKPPQELDTVRWKEIIDEITTAGCLYLLITGGEPLLRKDFKEIYSHAKHNGLLVTVFTNGTLVNEEILDLFTELPPRAVEISLYGATAGTYERITGVKGSFEKCLNGIRGLKERQVKLRVKTMLMTLNKHEFSDIEKMAREWDAPFRFDAALFPTLQGEQYPLDMRIDAREAVEIEFSDVDRARQWRDFYERMADLPYTDKLYSCGAAVTHFHIDARGVLQPCLMVTHLEYNLNSGSFLTGWNEVLPRLRQRKAKEGNICNTCKKRTLCGFCPGFFYLEKGAEEVRSEYLCAMGQERFEKINELNHITES